MAPGEGPREPRTDGERWAREELQALHAARFSPAATARFLLRSQRRAAGVRASRPDLARQELRWLAAGAAGWTALAAAGVQPFRRRARDGLAWWALCGLMLDWHLGMLETEGGEPRPLGPADALTLLRAWLVPAALDAPAPALLGIAAATDVLDGIAARRTAPTRAGRDLEGLVDVCFALAALRGARRRDWIGRAAADAEIARLAAGTAYAFAVYLGRARPPSAAVTRAGRLTSQARVPGLVAAATGRRRLADALVGGGAIASLTVLARAVAAR